MRRQARGSRLGRAVPRRRVLKAIGALREADRQAAPRRDPHAVRLAGHRPGRRHQSRALGARPNTRHQARQDAGADADEARQLLDCIDVSSSSACAIAPSSALMVYQLRPRRRRDRHARRGLLRPGQALVGAAARERRQAPRDALPPQPRSLSRRLSRGGRPHRGEEEVPSSAQRADAPARSPKTPWTVSTSTG